MKTKTWLRSKKVVLINEGIQAPLEEASYLQAMGVSHVSILKDGLYGWHLSGGELKGDAFTYSRLGTVEASCFATMTEEKPWLFIGLFEDEKAFSSHEFLKFPAPNNSDELVTQIRYLLNGKKDNQRFLFIDREGEWENVILRTLHELKKPDAWYLKDGLQGWRHFQQQKQAQKETRIQTSVTMTRPGHRRSTKTKKSCGCGKK